MDVDQCWEDEAAEIGVKAATKPSCWWWMANENSSGAAARKLQDARIVEEGTDLVSGVVRGTH